MELKLTNALAPLFEAQRINRTFMELKQGQRRSIADALQVLIEPLWN